LFIKHKIADFNRKKNVSALINATCLLSTYYVFTCVNIRFADRSLRRSKDRRLKANYCFADVSSFGKFIALCQYHRTFASLTPISAKLKRQKSNATCYYQLLRINLRKFFASKSQFTAFEKS